MLVRKGHVISSVFVQIAFGRVNEISNNAVFKKGLDSIEVKRSKRHLL